MVQQIVYTDKVEYTIIKNFKNKWKVSKADTIKRIIREFKENDIKK